MPYLVVRRNARSYLALHLGSHHADSQRAVENSDANIPQKKTAGCSRTYEKKGLRKCFESEIINSPYAVLPQRPGVCLHSFVAVQAKSTEKKPLKIFVDSVISAVSYRRAAVVRGTNGVVNFFLRQKSLPTFSALRLKR